MIDKYVFRKRFTNIKTNGYLKLRSNSNIKIKGEIDRKINPYSRCEVA